MKLIGIFNLFGSCAASFILAVLAFNAGFGLVISFLIYAFGGAFFVILATAILYVAPQPVPKDDDVMSAELLELRHA